MYHVRITFNSNSKCPPLDFLFNFYCPFYLRTNFCSPRSNVDITWSKKNCLVMVIKDSMASHKTKIAHLIRKRYVV